MSAETERVQLDGVSEATDEMRGIAKQALEWVRVSEERVAEAEGRAEARPGDDAGAERRAGPGRAQAAGDGDLEEDRRGGPRADRRRAREAPSAEGASPAAEQARDRAEKAFEQARQRDQADREASPPR